MTVLTKRLQIIFVKFAENLWGFFLLLLKKSSSSRIRNVTALLEMCPETSDSNQIYCSLPKMKSVKKKNSCIFCFPVSRSFYDYHRSSGLVQQLHEPLDLPGLLGPHVQQVRPPHFTVVDSLHARCHDDRGLGIALAHLHV